MARPSRVTVRGTADLKRALARLSAKMPQAVQKALTQAALNVERGAKQRCPVDTGRLRASITHRAEADRAEVFTVVEYAPYVEHGTSRRAASPFLFPAAEEERPEYERRIREAAKKVLP